eukprot:1331451-Rhodomonas_salina.3
MDGWMEGGMSEWMDGWMEGGMDGKRQCGGKGGGGTGGRERGRYSVRHFDVSSLLDQELTASSIAYVRTGRRIARARHNPQQHQTSQHLSPYQHRTSHSLCRMLPDVKVAVRCCAMKSRTLPLPPRPATGKHKTPSHAMCKSMCSAEMLRCA